MLSDFGLTHNQAKVYIALAKLGLASASEASKVSNVRREDIYRILPKLEKMGLIERILGNPIKVRATPIKEALSLLIKRERDIANRKVSALNAKKDECLKLFKAYKVKPISKEAHFALISRGDAIVDRALTMIKKSEREIALVTSKDKFIQIFTDYGRSVKKALRKGVEVQVILQDVFEHEDLIQRIMEEYKSSGGSFDLKYTNQPSGHYMIVDYNQAIIGTSTKVPIAENPHLWTNDNDLVGLFQKDFESIWHDSERKIS